MQICEMTEANPKGCCAVPALSLEHTAVAVGSKILYVRFTVGEIVL